MHIFWINTLLFKISGFTGIDKNLSQTCTKTCLKISECDLDDMKVKLGLRKSKVKEKHRKGRYGWQSDLCLHWKEVNWIELTAFT